MLETDESDMLGIPIPLSALETCGSSMDHLTREEERHRCVD